MISQWLRRGFAPVVADLALAAMTLAFMVFLVGLLLGWWIIPS